MNILNFADSKELIAQIKLIRKYLKIKLVEDNVTFRGHTEGRQHVYDLFRKTVLQGDSHSALLIGPRGCGKTTLVNSVLHELSKEVDIDNDAIIVQLNGLVHHDDKLALKSITAQMQLENAVGDRVFGTFAENLSFLLSCIQSGTDRKCRSMIFVLDQCDMFCHSGISQTLLYNLFDVTHSRVAPVCVLGVTNRLDIMELFEKRVKSRFSHRHIFIFPNEITENDQYTVTSPLDNCKGLLVELLSMPQLKVESPRKKRRGSRKSIATDSLPIDTNCMPEEVLKGKLDVQQLYELDQTFVQEWNCHIDSLVRDDTVVDALEKFCYYTVNEQVFRDVLFQVVCKLSSKKPYIDAADLITTIDQTVGPDHRLKMLDSLSVLELSLLIAMIHGMDIFDGQPMNFEMVLHRYTKFANTNSSTQTVPRPVIQKAFEHLQELELIIPVKGGESESRATATGRSQRDHRLYAVVARGTVRSAIQKLNSLPTEVRHWAQSDLMGNN